MTDVEVINRFKSLSNEKNQGNQHDIQQEIVDLLENYMLQNNC